MWQARCSCTIFRAVPSWRAIWQHLSPLVIAIPLPDFCIGQDRLGYFVVTKNSKTLVSYNKKCLFLYVHVFTKRPDPYNMGASHKHNVDWKKSDIKEDILHVAEFFSDPPRCLEPGRHISAPSYSVKH